ncbi:nucleoside 2-deoxyribosyltransferase [Hymenobacter sp. HSC-4F20]|uniref:PfkB family carbohydrate kinase n=1 Tax=Hymenobacter sp. HSC-4F20 TaxID=2864135 RepID=UPI001C73B19F|nr:PfkB family carbohydrate kinase [Hymenobacter sp. HSC-4F20]MBX0293126.1 nucleoside 2-deoxyribosyltransferase [Hymenobacter sp. HSC-4F20]
MLTIVGGTYLELCREPHSEELYGSGLRAAVALSGNITDIHFHSCVGADKLGIAEFYAEAYRFRASFSEIPKTIAFHYYHPLAPPYVSPREVLDQPKLRLPAIQAEAVLLYGQVEAEVEVTGTYVVYDPQNHIPWKQALSTAKHLALVLNRKEALLLSGLPKDTELAAVGNALLSSEQAAVIIIKNGSQGALVIDHSGTQFIPVFKTTSVWPIGSGDIFSAVFAWQWAVNHVPPAEAARLASLYTAHYCQTKQRPLPVTHPVLEALDSKPPGQLIYLAGPFFTMAERWLINELRDKLLEFGNMVFSPLHDVGAGPPHQVVEPDLNGIRRADVVLAVATGLDAGTLFEIGYARALGKRVVVFAENTTEHDLTMLIGSDCEITSDLSSAVYRASW